ncbi:sigma-E processing peptidase SpoIIGA [Brevibacillus fluminis]|uniref:sigma-E processing peptidase SpoIIGA n=1 Tax=Brevibacillus fluminis TaxID=511487 RepID=UPI003F88B65B
MVIYLDVILLLNLAIDAMLLYFTAYFRKERVVWWRLLLAAAFGSTYVAFFFFPAFAGMYQWMVKLLFSILMLWIAFGFRRILSFFQTLCIFYFVAFVFGGGVFALEYLGAGQNEIVNGILVTHNDSFGVGTKPTLLVLAAGFAIVIFLSRRSYQAIAEPKRMGQFLTEVVVKLGDEHILCTGLIDTGNQLYEPFSRTPVMLMESRLFAHLLPSALAAYLAKAQDKMGQVDEVFAELAPEWQTRLRLIPYRSVSRGMDFLIAIKPDGLSIVVDGQTFQATKVLIGLNPIALSADGRYQAIVHPALIQSDPQAQAISNS